jgi:large subunit ribosomal protein L32
MPQEPKKRHSRQRQGKRRAAINFTLKSAIACPNCGTLNMPHTICRNCGFYRGRGKVEKKEEPKETTETTPQEENK